MLRDEISIPAVKKSDWKKIDNGNGTFVFEKPINRKVISNMPYRTVTFVNMSFADYTKKRLRKLLRNIDFFVFNK